MLFSYLAISKMLYWINFIFAGYEDVWRVVLQRFLTQDILIIIVVVFIYFFEHKFVLKQKKLNSTLADIITAIGGYIIFFVVALIYVMIVDSQLPTPANIWLIITSDFMINLTVVYFIIFVALTMKERFKKKEAYNYAVDIQSMDIKMEMLKTLLDDGVLSQDEFDKQEAKLLETQSSVIVKGKKRTLKVMDEDEKARLTKMYDNYSVFDWFVSFAFVALIIFGVQNISAPLLAAIIIAGFVYTAGCVWLYIKVWSIKEIRNKGVYWFDWVLAIAFTAFEVYVLYTVMTGAELFWVERINELIYSLVID